MASTNMNCITLSSYLRKNQRPMRGNIDTVKTNSEAFNTPYNEELHRTIIHGILHLCGINDKGPGEREIMEANENKALAILPEECRESQLSR